LLRTRPTLFHLLLLLPLLGLAFGLHLSGKWVWDDVVLVQHNPHLVGVAGLKRLLTRDLWAAAGAHPSDVYRPIPMLLIWALVQLAGKSLVVLRLANLLIHGANNLLFAAWLRRSGVSPGASIALALSIAVHPIVCEPVMWIVGSHDLCGSGFCLLAMWLWPRPDDRRRLLRVGLASIATTAAALCKEPYCIISVILALTAVLGIAQPLSARPSTAHQRQSLANPPAALWRCERGTILLGPLAGLGIAVVVRRWLLIDSSSQLAVAGSSHARNFAAILEHYLAYGISFRAAPTTQSFRACSPGATAVVLLGAFAVTLLLTIWTSKRNASTRLAVFGWGWFLIALLPHLLAMPIIGMYGNRYAYFPLYGLACMFAGLLSPLERYWPLPAVRRWRILAPMFLGVATLFTSAEASLWRDEMTLFGAALEHDPFDPNALYHYGSAVVESDDGCAAALPYFEAAASRNPTQARAWHNIAGCLIRLQRTAEALPAALMAFKLQPTDAGAAYNLAVVRLATGQRGTAEELLDLAVRLDPRHPAARQMRAQLSAINQNATR
jgi:protein O-mannosyl-transferase